MTEATVVLSEPPASGPALLTAIETQRGEIRRWTSEGIRRLEAQRDQRLEELDRLATLLDVGHVDPPISADVKKRPPERAKKTRPKHGRGKNVQALAQERRDAVHRFLIEQGHPASPSEIREALGLSAFMTGSALRRLMDERRVKRVGENSKTRYVGIARTPAPGSQSSPQGSILHVIEERGYASPSELAQATGLSAETVRAQCGALIAEGEVQMSRRDGKGVYQRVRVV